jgi:hypothetical protein
MLTVCSGGGAAAGTETRCCRSPGAIIQAEFDAIKPKALAR